MSRIEKAMHIRRLAKQLGEYDSNISGMVGEVMAEEHYQMAKAPRGTKKTDGHLPDGRSLQVKVIGTWRDAVRVHTTDVDALLVIKLTDEGWREVYFGDAAAAVEASTNSERNGSKDIWLNHLAKCPGANPALIVKMMHEYNANRTNRAPYSEKQIRAVEAMMGLSAN